MTVETPPMPHQLILTDRSELTATGVSHVDSFDDGVIVAHTSLGELTVKGHGLHIRHLNVDTGDLAIEGHIDSMEYSQASTERRGFFGRLLR